MMQTRMHGFVDTDTTVRERKPELRIQPNRAVLADTGTPVRNLGLMTRANIEGLVAGVYRSGDRSYDIRVKFKEEQGKSQVEEFLVPAKVGRAVLLNTFATVTEHDTLIQITRADKRRVGKVYSQLTPDFPQGTAMANLSEAIDQKKLLPTGYEYRFRGKSEYLAESMLAFLEAGILAVLLSYLALAAILESFTRPFFILTTLPLALIGVLWSLYLTGENISVFVMLSIVLLIGIVVNNAILILDRMQLLRTQGVESYEAILQAIKLEFRAVLMVTLAAVLGMLPLAVSQGLGSELSVGMGIASVGGIAVSAVLTLLAIPTLFILVTRRS